MEKTWKKASLYEYKRCFDILNNDSLIEKDTYKKFAITLFEVAKKQIGVDNAKLKFVDEMQNFLGSSTTMDYSVTLNLQKMEKQTLFKTVSTIYHELTHLKQAMTDKKKQLDSVIPTEFPFIHCYGNEAFLPKEILGISSSLFYYTCQHEKEARDMGSECAMDLFKKLEKIAKTQETKNGTIRLIERCINQVQTRWDEENRNNELATADIKSFMAQNPNFTHIAFAGIKQEFLRDYLKFGLVSKERLQCEDRFNRRVGALVLLGCDDKLKNDILSFTASNFIDQKNVFVSLVSVIDSPYSKVSKDDMTTLFKLGDKLGCPRDILYGYLTSWNKNYVREIIEGRPAQKTHFTINGIDYEL